MAVVTGCRSECKISMRCSYRIPGHDKSDSRIHVLLNNGYKLCVTKSTTRVQQKKHKNLYILRVEYIHEVMKTCCIGSEMFRILQGNNIFFVHFSSFLS